MGIDLTRVKQKKVRTFLEKSGLAGSGNLGKLRPLCYREGSAKPYRRHLESFIIEADVERVWETYATIHPKDAWKGKMVTFGLQFSSVNKRVSYLNDAYDGMEKGQVLILNLSLLWGLVNIAVAHEVSEINPQQHIIKMCYMEGGASEGSQWIYLNPAGEGYTEVIHLTYFRSKSWFRDSFLYPPLHTKAIREFHHNIKKHAESRRG